MIYEPKSEAESDTTNLLSEQKERFMYDLTGIPTAICPMCGCDHFKMVVKFDPHTYEIDMYGLEEAECYGCGTKLTPPTPLDIPENIGREI